jgi:hypothetical protein
MRKLIILILVVCLASIVLTACGSDDKDDKKNDSGPVDAVRAYFAAFEAKDHAGMQAVLCAHAGDALQVDANLIAIIESVRFENAQYDEISQDDTSAVVHVQGNLIIVMGNVETPTPTDSNFQLKKVDGKWCLFDSDLAS